MQTLTEKIGSLLEKEQIKSTHCFAVPGKDNVIDDVHPLTGRGTWSGETLDQIQLRHPGAAVVSWDDWKRAKAATQDAPVEWQECTEERYEEMMNVLPPAEYSRHGFLVGEPWDHHAMTGCPRYSAFIMRGCRHYASSRPMTVVEFRQQTKEQS
jgi:hypothetical protein